MRAGRASESECTFFFLGFFGLGSPSAAASFGLGLRRFLGLGFSSSGLSSISTTSSVSTVDGFTSAINHRR